MFEFFDTACWDHFNWSWGTVNLTLLAFEAGQEREYFLSIDDLVQVQRVHSRSASFSPDTQF